MKKLSLLIISTLLMGSISYATLTVNTIPRTKTSGTTPSIQDSALSDNGTTVTSTENVAAPGFTLGGVTKTSWASSTGQWVGTPPGPIYYNQGDVAIGATTPISSSIFSVQGVINEPIAEFCSNIGSCIAFDQYNNFHVTNQNELGIYYDNNVGYYSISATGNNDTYITSGESATGSGNVRLYPYGGEVISNVGYHSNNALGGIVAQSGLFFDPIGPRGTLSAYATTVNTSGTWNYPTNGINWTDITNIPPSSTNWPIAPGNTAGYVWTSTGSSANWQAPLAGSSSGVNWSNLTGITTSINWEGGIFKNFGINWATFNDIGAQNTNWSDINIYLNTVTETNPNIGTTNTDGVLIRNITPAALGAQQYSPNLHLEGEAWGTTASATQSVDLINYLVPVQGASTVASVLNWAFASNGGSYTSEMNLNNQGVLTASTMLAGTSGTGNYYAANSTGGLSSGNIFYSGGAQTAITSGHILNGSASNNSYSGTGLITMTYSGTGSGVNTILANTSGSSSGDVLQLNGAGTGNALNVQAGHIKDSGATCGSIGPVGACWTSSGQLGYCSGAAGACSTCTAC